MTKQSKGIERRQIIIKSLENQRYVDVCDLAAKFNVTEVTIRNDLSDLESRGLLVRTHGGAVLAEDRAVARRFGTTISENIAKKESIAKLAASFVHEGDTVLLDSGSTVAILARELKDLQLTVITNSIPVIEEFKDVEKSELIAIGGVLRRMSFSLIGAFSNKVLEAVNADILFMGCTNFDVERGITASNILEGQTKQFMLHAAKKRCLIADSTKIGQSALFSVCGWDMIDCFITDSLEKKDVERLEKDFHVNVVLPPSQVTKEA